MNHEKGCQLAVFSFSLRDKKEIAGQEKNMDRSLESLSRLQV